MSRRVCWLAVALLAGVVFAGTPAQAVVMTLADQNSRALVDPAAQRGMFSWTVDGTEYLNQQWFWYRVGNTQEASVDALTLVSATMQGGNVLSACYRDPQAGFQIDAIYTLVGGQLQSGSSSMQEFITISNTGGSALPFSFFQYSDFNLSSVPGHARGADDSITMLNAYVEAQIGPFWNGTDVDLTETTVFPAATAWEAHPVFLTRNRLNDALPTVLDGTSLAGLDDVAWAFQWDKVIEPGKDLQISKKKLLTVVPEPVSLSLLLLGAMALPRRRRR
jgi:hypothetical protein